MASHDYDIVIVGGGIVGLALARGVAGSGYRVALVEATRLARERPSRASRVDQFDARVSALTAASARWLEQLGAWPLMREIAVSPYTHMRVWDADGTGVIGFDAALVREPALGHIVENRVTAWALLESLRGRGIEWIEAAQVVATDPVTGGTGRTLTLDDGRTFSAALVVGADGAHSGIRRYAAIPTREWDYGHHAVVATIETEREHDDTARQWFLPEGPLALLPLRDAGGGRHFCSIVWSAEPALAQQLTTLDDTAFREAVTAASERALGAVRAVGRRRSFPLRQRHARRYHGPAIALVGDAAHTIHPLAGQGMNLGLDDAAALADGLQRAAMRGLDPGGEAVLGRYQRRRLGDNLAMMAAMEGFKRLFAERRLPVRWLRNTGMSGLDRLDFAKRAIIRRAMRLG